MGQAGGVTSDRTIGPYRLVERLGRGGMGEVWRAEDPTGAAGGAPRPVAVKLLDPGVATNPDRRARFAREVAALQRVDSPYVAPLLDADVDTAVPWLASALVAGPTLAEHVARHGPLPDRPLRALGAALAEALAAIHAAGVVHRDLTPRNVVLGPDGPRVVDFGIAWFPGAVPVTQPGASVGTPAWMAPERVASGEATAAGDVWSWGAVMAYAAGAAGDGDGVTHGLPGWLDPWVRAALATDPGARPTAAELRAGIAPATADDTLDASAEITRVVTATREAPAPAAAAGDTRILGDRGGRGGTGGGAPGAAPARGRAAWWGSGAVVVAAAAVVGAVVGLLASVIAAAVLVVAALGLQFRRERLPEGARPLPPTWAVALAGPVVLGVGLMQAIGPIPGLVVLVVLIVVFLIVAGDIVT